MTERREAVEFVPFLTPISFHIHISIPLRAFFETWREKLFGVSYAPKLTPSRLRLLTRLRL